jgi:hypothetical protein
VLSNTKNPRMTSQQDPKNAMTHVLPGYTALIRIKRRPEVDGMIKMLAIATRRPSTLQVSMVAAA